jgi:hypothetical protein
MDREMDTTWLFVRILSVSAEHPPTFKSYVTLRYQVRGENQDALIILELAQEDRHKCIPCDVAAVPLGQEYICFVEQYDCLPLVCQFEHLREFRVDIVELRSKLSGGK